MSARSDAPHLCALGVNRSSSSPPMSSCTQNKNAVASEPPKIQRLPITCMFSTFRLCSRRLTSLVSPRAYSAASVALMPKRKRNIAVESVMQAVVETETTPQRASRKKSKTESWDPYASIDASSPLTSPSPPPTKAKRRKRTNEPVVYDIPPVTNPKTTTFKGRLGYACLNTILRTADPPIFCSRTCRIATLKQNGLQHAKDLGIQNARDLKKMVEWNEENGIKFMRISSEMFPFASHKEWGYDLEYAKEVLKEAGATAKRLGHRLTTHPGQFTQLASPKENVVEASIRELDCTSPMLTDSPELTFFVGLIDHCQMMRHMGLGKDSVIILHMGVSIQCALVVIRVWAQSYSGSLRRQDFNDRSI